MNASSQKQAYVWGGLLVLFGVLGVIETFTDISDWAWIAILAASGLVAFAIYLTERSKWTLLIPAYVLLLSAGLIALITQDLLRGELIASYVLVTIGLPFLAVYLHDRKNWWALIPAYAILAIGVMVGLIGLNLLTGAFIATFVLTSIAIPFLAVFLLNRANWWALIPAYVLIAIGAMVGLIQNTLLAGFWIPAYIMFAIAIPFLVVYLFDTTQWWLLIPGGIMAAIGFSFVLSAESIRFVAPALLCLIGVWILIRQLAGKTPVSPDMPPPVVEEPDSPLDD